MLVRPCWAECAVSALSFPFSDAALVENPTVAVADHDVLRSGPVGEALNPRGRVGDANRRGAARALHGTAVGREALGRPAVLAPVAHGEMAAQPVVQAGAHLTAGLTGHGPRIASRNVGSHGSTPSGARAGEAAAGN